MADDATTQPIRKILEENIAACDAGDLSGLMQTMTSEPPTPERFTRDTLKECTAADTSTPLVEIQILKRGNPNFARFRFPYGTVRIVRVMPQSTRAPWSEAPSELSRMFGLNQEHPVVEFETLWRREGGKCPLVATITEPSPSVATSEDRE